MRVRGKPAHIGPDLGDDDVRAEFTDSRNGDQLVDGVAKALIDLVIYFACVSAGQSPPVIRSLGPALLIHLCECLLGLVLTMRRSSRQVIVTHVARLLLHHSNPKLNVPARQSANLHIIRCSS